MNMYGIVSCALMIKRNQKCSAYFMIFLRIAAPNHLYFGTTQKLGILYKPISLLIFSDEKLMNGKNDIVSFISKANYQKKQALEASF